MMVQCHRVIIMIIMLFHNNIEASSQCDHGEVRLVSGSSPNEGRVEICACTCSTCVWGTVCHDDWGDQDAQVVCRQLNYRPVDAQAFSGAHFGRGAPCQLISLDSVGCNGNEMTLLECGSDTLFRHNCDHGKDAGVRCAGESLLLSNRVMNVSINNITNISTRGINLYTVLISWKWQNNSTQNQPNSFQIECFSSRLMHRVGMSVNTTTFSVDLLGLLSSTSYNCCVSVVYGSQTARAFCTEIATIQPPISETPTMQPIGGPTVKPEGVNPSTCQTLESSSISSSSADTIGGVLGSIIAVLLILLAVSGAALVYLLRLKCKESSVAADGGSTDVPIRRNVSYIAAALSRSTSVRDSVQIEEQDEYSHLRY